MEIHNRLRCIDQVSYLGLFVIILILGISTQGLPVLAIKEIPQAKCVYDGEEYVMNPRLTDGERKISRIDFPKLNDIYNPQMTLEKGDRITVEFDHGTPKQLNAYLVDYDADVSKPNSLTRVNHNTFEATETGVRTLEAVATFEDGYNISYLLLVDVED